MCKQKRPLNYFYALFKPRRSVLNTFAWVLVFTILLLFLLIFIPNKKIIKASENLKPINVTSPEFKFVDTTIASGLTHQHKQHTGKITDLIDGLSAGACVADFDNDGWMDVIFTTGGGQTRFYGGQSWWDKHSAIEIYKNQNGFFVNKTPHSNIELVASTTACRTLDLNNDGLTDLVIASTHQDYIFKNIGDFKFEQIPTFSKIALNAWTSHISIIDINHDGLFDLHLSHLIRYQKNQKNLEDATGFSEQHLRQLDPSAYDGIQNQLLINQGDFQFSDQTRKYFNHQYAERTLAANWLDLNQDGLLDLIEFNLAKQPTRTYLQIPKGQLKQVSQNQWPLYISHSHFASAMQNINDSKNLLLMSRAQGLASLAIDINEKKAKDIGWQLGLNSNSYLHLNRWGIALADFNNNGLTDFAIATGSYQPNPFSPQSSLASHNLCARKIQTQLKYPQFKLSACSDNLIQSSRTAIRLDFNNDGQQDLLFANNNDFVQLLQNTTANSLNWINLQIPDLAKWHSAKLQLETNGKQINTGINLQDTLFGNHDPRLHFGLGDYQQVQVKLFTADGQLAFSQQLAANQFYQWKNTQWQPVLFTPTPKQLPFNVPDLATAIRTLQSTQLSQNQLIALNQLLSTASSAQVFEVANLIATQPQIKHLALYHNWLNVQSDILNQASFNAIKQLEPEQSVSTLLNYLSAKATPVQFCKASEVFATWFEQEEAVTQFKYKAIPYLFKALNRTEDKVVICAADALGHAEHKNASSAILTVLLKKSAPVQARLINALGKTRQTEANKPILDLLLTTESPAVIQQALIALTRLKQANLTTFISQISEPSKQQALFIALINFTQASDHIVIMPKVTQAWLAQLSPHIKFNQLQSSQAKQAYLIAADLGYLPPIKLPVLLDNKNTEVALSAARLLIKHNQINAKPDAYQLWNKILNLPLNPDTLIKLSTQISQAYLNQLTPTNLSQTQNQNSLAVFAKLSPNAQKQLSQILSYYPSSILNLGLPLCEQFDISHTLTAEASLNAFVSSCRLIFLSQQADLAQLKQQVTQIAKTNSVAQQHVLAYLLKYKNMAKLPTTAAKLFTARLSAAFFTHTRLPAEFKNRWASAHFTQDKASLNWLKQALKTTDEALLNQLLTQAQFTQLEQALELNKLNTIGEWSKPTQQRLAGFYIQAGYKLNPYQEAIQ
ncbi:FG-GAP-like repeat-containing protein [Catenovulum adriaticum]|uniref:FG-GAP-like repeat-containing protein n=1 Tax=Catenovulum adriaticum TaxID=2984846 RepID=A0ABY7AKU1_9ALTE|nr:FG-GAP-like repeat-containing protein [Catenovulum sp. TS8]WAJ70162.1 FG-GAP-like repeat-containing protein [Catenovulum sp. TS8]